MLTASFFLLQQSINPSLSTGRQFRHYVQGHTSIPGRTTHQQEQCEHGHVQAERRHRWWHVLCRPQNSSNGLGAPDPGNGPGRAGRIIDACAPESPPTQCVDEPDEPHPSPLPELPKIQQRLG